MRYENPYDPEFHPAREHGHTVTDDDGITTTSFYLEDRQESVEIVQREGEWFARLQDFSGDEH